MRIVCQQTILIKYHALFVIFEKRGKIWNCRLLQIIGGALWVKDKPDSGNELRSPQSIMGMILQSGVTAAGTDGRTVW